MMYVRPRPFLIPLTAYVVGGVAIGLLHAVAQSWAARWLGRAGFGTAFIVNIAMPLLIVQLAMLYPRLWVALAGTFGATLALLLCMGLTIPSLQRGWIIDAVVSMHPVLTVACGAYHVLAFLAVLAARPFRRVGSPPDPSKCAQCGYTLTGLTQRRCPECGSAFCARTGGIAPRDVEPCDPPE